MAIALPAGEFRGIDESDAMFPGTLGDLIAEGAQALQAAGERLASGRRIDPRSVEWLPPLSAPGKIICVGLNYVDHSIESGFVPPTYPTLFARFSTSLIGHGAAIRRPEASIQLDYEGEMVAIIGKAGRHIAPGQALSHVAGYSIFNDASIRDFQTKSPQWTVGKNFDGTGSFGPIFVTADELPPGGKGLRIQTRLNGEVVQNASTSDMIFDVASLISIISEAITLEPGDILVTGTPSGVGMARKPQLFMKHGDVCEVELEDVGILSNVVADDVLSAQAVNQ
ncbi:fumarylacetoacetate hydrolase family protein [Mesorhizobium sangaii]|uniref:2-keto-4-pentenoate hydratase/2-oxohepta-3-ene-1,7-dioic acid hydratase in catechol pathway n=1 Tax=Mesorhizobium sangaii TaxID=505389 RepID=A0A841PEA5_9HYPH|nr:fumarylacetoacetate hydrolase family protein [Mesorhizobium sangaii]MBB6408572.1 2-keto-4-pentenoate hydratase/2-oxohepta-3-ene-1,7-dioic acid hydratase in catechol pathway [Mesorhizobium sangaii]